MQTTWKRSMVLLFGTAACGLLLALGSPSVEARPQYKKEFESNYPKVKENNKVTCNACHQGSDKKKRNGYGMALGKMLDSKNLKDADKIKEAFKKTEKEKSAVDGKTYGDLLKDGKLPNEGEKEE